MKTNRSRSDNRAANLSLHASVRPFHPAVDLPPFVFLFHRCMHSSAHTIGFLPTNLYCYIPGHSPSISYIIYLHLNHGRIPSPYLTHIHLDSSLPSPFHWVHAQFTRVPSDPVSPLLMFTPGLYTPKLTSSYLNGGSGEIRTRQLVGVYLGGSTGSCSLP